ncbi:MAG: TonB-dependent receptor, partial [Planctomycetota bacterium]|nr:TonB-dependent receptor [Planctomycetota bacterium]
MGRSGLLRCVTACVIVLAPPGAGARAAPDSHRVAELGLSGRVVDDESGEAVAGASIEAVGSGRGAVSDALGRFTLRGIEDGVHRVRVTHLAYEPLSLPAVRLAGGTGHAVELRLRRRVHRLAPVLVEAPRKGWGAPGARGREAGGVVDFLDGERLRAEGAADLGDALRSVPGVEVRDVQGARTVSVRGLGPEAVRVLVDGVPINDPATGVADLRLVPIGEIEWVEVRRGATAGASGAGAAAGVVSVGTRGAADAAEAAEAADLAWAAGPGARGPEGEAGAGPAPHPGLRVEVEPRVEVGSFGRRGGVLRASGRKGPARATLTAGAEAFEGDYDVPLSSYPFDSRVNGDEEVRHGSGSLAWVGPVSADASVSWRRSEEGLPGTAEYVTPEARSRSERTALRLGLHRPSPAGADLRANLSFAWSWREHVSPAEQGGLRVFPSDFSSEARGARADARATIAPPGAAGVTILTAELARDRYRDEDRLDPGRGV